MKIKVKLIEDGKMPTFAHATDACADCYARTSDVFISIPPGERCRVNLGFAIELPESMEAVVRPRSGLTGQAIDIKIGTIDCGYTGEVKACVVNNSKGYFVINKGDRICQIAFREKPFIELQQVSELAKSERGENGFGSTGI